MHRIEVGDLVGTAGFYTKVKTPRSQADRIFVPILALIPDSPTLLVVALAAWAGSMAMWQIFAATIDHATRVHDTRVRVAELQIKYLHRAQAFRAQSEPIEVGEAEEQVEAG